jgi:hypothetical protein
LNIGNLTSSLKACLSAFKDEVKDKSAEAFYVSIEKLLTVDQKRKLKAEAKKRFDELKEANLHCEVLILPKN